MGQWFSSIRDAVASRRAVLVRLAFDLLVGFAGVTAAFALENYRQDHEDARYHQRMVAALGISLDGFAHYGGELDGRLAAMLQAYDRSVSQGDRPVLPIYRESGGERPPTRAWDGIIATGAARALDPELFFRLARFYSRVDSFGDRYQRYNAFTESRVLPYVGRPVMFYEADGRTLKPEFAAYVERLRDLDTEEHRLVVEAAELRDGLPKS